MTGRRVLHLLVPGLLDLPDIWLREQNGNLACEALGRLLDSAIVETIPRHDFESALAASFGISSRPDADLPCGAVTRQAACRDAVEGVWACADPLHLVAGIRDVQAEGGIALALTRDEAVALTDRFNAHFAGSGLTLLPTRPDRWHLRLPEDPLIVTRPLGEIIGRPLRDNLPRGPGALHWHALLTEIQMLFHDASANAGREAQGRPIVNGLWVWGIGRLPVLQAEFAMLSAGPSTLAADFATACDVTCLKDGVADLLDAAGGWPRLLVTEALRDRVSRDDWDGWWAELARLIDEVLMPVEAALRRGAIERLVIDSCDGCRHVVEGGRLAAVKAAAIRLFRPTVNPWGRR